MIAEPLYCGVDPGVTGAVALLDQAGNMVLLEDLPVLASGKTTKVSRSLNPAGLALILAPFRERIQVAALERVSAMPGQGVSSVFSSGDSFGCLRGTLASLGIPIAPVSPATWKRALKLDSDKERCRTRAIEPLPTAALHRKKDHNRAEALLLALWATRPSAQRDLQ